ncbi:MAG TPA: pyridoxal-dependent decarboxylase [Gemmatimonadaceae bacterium]|nr:pyridoxal-dependent decarboxylase [Gemmatimonadaceae bacterium]
MLPPSLVRALADDATPDAARRIIDLAVDFLDASRSGAGPVSTALSSSQLAARFREPMPAEGVPLEWLTQRVRDDVLSDANHLTHPMYMGHQVSSPLPVAIWIEAVISAMNQSIAVAEMSPTATVLETQLIRWMCESLGWGSASGGTFTSGGTEATFTALLAARARAMPDAWRDGVGDDAPSVVCGEHAHYAVTRAVGELGLGMRRVISIPSRDWRMDPDALSAALETLAASGQRAMAVVATAGSTATGSFDDLERIGVLCERHETWLHVDGAHGASALLSRTHRSRMRGIQRARSVAWDPHKMMLMPLAAGMLLVRDERDLSAAFAQQAPYLFHSAPGERGWDQGTRSFMCSRRADALKLWAALQRYGSSGLAALYDHLCETTQGLHAEIIRRGDFEALHTPESNILCFRYLGTSANESALDALNASLRERYNASGDGWITTTILGGRRVLRVTIMNPHTTPSHTSRMLDTLARLAGA